MTATDDASLTCFRCGADFDSAGLPDPVCPRCGVDQRESPALRARPEGRRGRLAASAKTIAPEPEEPAAPDEDDDAEDDDAEDDDV